MSLYSDIKDIRVDSDKILKGQAAALEELKAITLAVVTMNVAIANLVNIITPMAADLKSIADGLLKDEVTGIVVEPGEPTPQP